MALADVVAVAQTAKNLVLIGDPQQLERPSRAAILRGREIRAPVSAWGPQDNSRNHGTLPTANMENAPIHL